MDRPIAATATPLAPQSAHCVEPCSRVASGLFRTCHLTGGTGGAWFGGAMRLWATVRGDGLIVSDLVVLAGRSAWVHGALAMPGRVYLDVELGDQALAALADDLDRATPGEVTYASRYELSVA